MTVSEQLPSGRPTHSIVFTAPAASALFMGLGQVVFLKQTIKGLLLMGMELLVLFFLIFELPSMTPSFHGPVYTAIHGFITLGDPKPDLPITERDHSIFMMIDGLIMIVILGLVAAFYVYGILDAKKTAGKYAKTGVLPPSSEFWHNLRDKAFPYIGLSPVVVMLSFFVVVPLLFSALIAFTDYSSPNHIPPNNLVNWTGVDSFVTMFGGGQNQWLGAFWRVMGWTVVWGVLSTVTVYFGGMLMAVSLLDKKIKLSKVFRTIFTLPYAIPQMISVFVWASLLNGQFGPINGTLMQLGIIDQNIPWLSDPTMAKVSILLVNLWVGFPYHMMLITGVMTSIQQDLFEAATIDGANKWQQFRYITLPHVLYQTVPILIMTFTFNINNFGIVFFMTNGGPAVGDTTQTVAGGTDLLISWIYKLTLNTPNHYNLASVLSILIFVVLAPVALWNFTRTKAFKDGEL